MSEANELLNTEADGEAGELTREDVELLRALDTLYLISDKIAIKKLSVNDRGWAWPIKQVLKRSVL